MFLATDKLRSYQVAHRAVLPSVEHRPSRYFNRTENSHQPTRHRERAMKRVRRYYHAIELVAGGLMVVIGVLIMTNRFSIITRALTPYLPTF